MEHDLSIELNREKIWMDLRLCKNVNTGIELMQDYLKHNPEDLVISSEIAYWHGIKGDPESIKKGMDICIECLNTEIKWELLYIYGILLAKNKSYFESFEIMREAIALNPDSSQIYFHIGKLYLISNNEEEAMEFFIEASKREPKLTDLDEYIENTKKLLSQKKKERLQLWR